MNIPIGKQFGEWYVEPSGWMVQWKVDQSGTPFMFYDVPPHRINDDRLIADMQVRRECDFDNFLSSIDYAKGL